MFLVQSILKCSSKTIGSFVRCISHGPVLPHEIDRFNAACVRLNEWSDDLRQIRDTLTNSVERWKHENRSSVWLWIPIEKAHVIPIAADLGFTYHHAEDRMAVLNKWLLPTKSMVPRFATHQVGVGGAVLRHDTNELLVIKERVRNLEFWKLPGGAAELEENIGDGAVREVFEETGIQSKFESIIGFRQSHRYPGGHGRSDLYFVCRLSALSEQINMDRNEVLDCQWLPLEQVLTLKNPILQRVAKQLLFGLRQGFAESIDFSIEQIPSIVTGVTFDFFARKIQSNQ